MNTVLKVFFVAVLAAVAVSNSWAADHCKALVIVGMADERAAALGSDVVVIVGTANATRLRERLSHVDTSHIKAVFSFGVAGGLDPTLQPGDLLLSTRVLAQNTNAEGTRVEQTWAGDPTLLMTASLRAMQPDHVITLRKGFFLGTDFEARDNPKTGEKDLHKQTGADIIDNESHIAAQFASEHNLPFLSVRAVSDSVNHPLPSAALLPLDPVTGGPDGKAIAKSLLAQPSQIPALIRTAWEYRKALNSLKQFRKEIGFAALTPDTQSCLNGK